MYCSRPEERWSEYLRFMGERPAADEKNQKYVNRVNTYKSFLLFKSFVGFVDLAVLDGCSLDSLELGALEEASIDMTLSLVTALSERLASLEEATEGSLRRLVEVVSFLLEMIKKKNIDNEVGTQTCSLLFNCHNLLLDKMRRCFLSDPASIPGLHEPVLKLLTAFIDSQTSNSVTDHRAFLSSVLGLVQATVAGDSSSLQEVKKKFLVVLCLIPLNYPQIEVAVFLQTVKSLAENLAGQPGARRAHEPLERPHGLFLARRVEEGQGRDLGAAVLGLHDGRAPDELAAPPRSRLHEREEPRPQDRGADRRASSLPGWPAVRGRREPLRRGSRVFFEPAAALQRAGPSAAAEETECRLT